MQIVEQNMQSLVEQKVIYKYVQTGARISDTGGGGDMTKAVYDPNTVEADAFDMANMSESATAKVLTATERSKLSGIESLAEVNNISDSDATDLTDGGETALHSHSGGGGIDYANPVSVTGAVSIPSTNAGKHHVCTGVASGYTISLPTTGLTIGALFSFEMSAALTELVTLDALAGQLIDGQQERILWSGEKAVLKWDGTNWQKISGVTKPMNARGDSVDFASAGTIPPNVTQVFPLVSASYDNGGMYDGFNDRIVCRRDGAYNTVFYQLYRKTGGMINTHAVQERFYINGVVDISFKYTQNPGTVLSETTTNAITVDLVAGDYLELFGFHTSTPASEDLVFYDSFLAVEEIISW